MTVNQLPVGLLLVENSDLVTAVLRSTANYCLGRGSFRIALRLLPLEPVPITMAWHNGTTTHPAHAWMRAQLVDTWVRLSSGAARTT
jgi:DNA-binding transcriptional LysR family regulator